MKKPRFKRNIFNKDKLSAWAKAVKKRDGYKCIACGYKGYLHSHHVLPKSKFPKHAYEIWNGVTLCKLCHLGRNGVHKTKCKPRNEIVKKLRKLLVSKTLKEVKDFTNTLIRKRATAYKPYRRFLKRKL